MSAAGGDELILFFDGTGLAKFVGSPADGAVGGVNGAGVAVAGGDGDEMLIDGHGLPARIGSPAMGSALGVQGTGVEEAACEGHEFSLWCPGRAPRPQSPAGNCAVNIEGACMSQTGGDGDHLRVGAPSFARQVGEFFLYIPFIAVLETEKIWGSLQRDRIASGDGQQQRERNEAKHHFWIGVMA